jgi:hypothetical protein
MNKMNVLFGISFLLLLGCKEDKPASEQYYAPPSNVILYDYSRINHYRKDFDISLFSEIVENIHSRFLIVPDYLTEQEIARLSENVDTMITRICLYLDTDIKKEYNGFEGKVSYFIEPGVIPKVYVGAPIPIVSLTKDRSLLSLYAHETVHIFSMNTYDLWLIEGLAVHLADSLGVERLWPNYSEDLHVHAKTYLNNQQALDLMGVRGMFMIDPTTALGHAFYTLSGSFVRYLIRNTGKQAFLKCYSNNNFPACLYDESEKRIDFWKKEWVAYLEDL